MNITASKFYSESGGSADFVYKDFIFKYKSEVEGVSTNKWMMENIIKDTKQLSSSTNASNFSLNFENGFIDLDPDDHVFQVLGNYFNSKGDLNTKKAGVILLYINGFLQEFRDLINIGDNLKTLDNIPLMEVIDKEIESTNIELGNLLEDLYNREPILKKGNINIRYIYLNTRLYKACSQLRKVLQSSGLKDSEFDAEYARLTGEINNIRNNYLDSINHKTKLSAKYLINTYNIMNYKTYANSGGSASKFKATLRGLIHNDKFYLLDSQYAGICGIN